MYFLIILTLMCRRVKVYFVNFFKKIGSMRQMHRSDTVYLVATLPKRWRKQSKNREYLQSADYHVCAEDKLTEP